MTDPHEIIGDAIQRHFDQRDRTAGSADTIADEILADLDAAGYVIQPKPVVCPSVIQSGPGHQSTHKCERTDGPHHHHHGYGYEWSTCQERPTSRGPAAFTDVVNRDPGHCDEHRDKEPTDG